MVDSMELVCNVDGCTLAQTGTCIFNNTPLSCPDRLASVDENDILPETGKSPVLLAPEKIEQFTSSYTLSVDAVQALMEERYCKIVGILGIPSTGKTACLVSLYLLLAHDSLDGFQFRNSKSLMAFEEISRGARKWDEGKVIEQLTVHTEIKDERTAGFLHLRVLEKESQKCFDILLPDLPGEWTTSLIEQTRTDRLNFLKGADSLWIMVNSEDIGNKKTRLHTIHRLDVLVDRLVEYLGASIPEVTIVATHSDKTESVVAYFDNFIEEAKVKGVKIKIREVASFSTDEDRISPGHGLSKIVSELCAGGRRDSGQFWKDRPIPPDARKMMSAFIDKG